MTTWFIDTTTVPVGPPSDGGYDLFSAIDSAIAEQVTAWLAGRGVRGVTVRWGVTLPYDAPAGQRPAPPEIQVRGWIQADDAAERRRALLAVHTALQAGPGQPKPITRHEEDGVLWATSRGGYVHRLPMEVAARFTAEEWPDAVDAHVPFADKRLWPDEGCPRCGCLSDAPGYGPGAALSWECERCGQQWQTLARPDGPERAQADAIVELASAAAARAATGTAHDAATERVRQTALAARETGVTTRRVVEVGQISPDTLGRWERAARR